MTLRNEAISISASVNEEENDIIFAEISQSSLGWQDLKEGLQKWRIWVMLAYQDVKLRYRRSVLGPFWLTLSMAITVYSMGFLYAHLFRAELQTYYPFLVAGMLSWSLISTVVLDLTEGFTASYSFIKGIKLPYSLFIHRVAARNIIIFFHNILVIIPVLAIFHESAKVNLNTLLLFPGLLIVYINTISYGLLIASVGARYRDVSQIIRSLVQVIFFVTPIMWGPEILKINGINHWLIDLNPFYAFVECIRAPLIGHCPTTTNLVVVAIMTLLGFLFSIKIFFRYRSRIIYWL